MQRNDLDVVDLLQCFFASCEQHFRFLEKDHKFSYISGLAEYRDNHKIIKPYHNHNVTTDFIALTRYEKGMQAIEILYGEQHFFLEGYVYYDKIQRFEFSEVLAAVKKDDRYIAGEWGLTDKSMIEKVIKKIAGTLESNIDLYTQRNEKVLARASVIRNKRIEQAVRKHFEKQIHEACLYAAKAFVEKNYAEVVALLQPLAFYLNAGDLKKLRLAEKYIHC